MSHRIALVAEQTLMIEDSTTVA